ncbi:MAG: hypothetical protein C4291_05795 [Candidatus Dadabacteria bacterium]
MEVPRNHKARLSVSMEVLEDTISGVEEIIRGANQRKAMIETLNNLSPWEKALILKRIDEIRGLITYVSQKLNLEKRREEIKNRILGAMTIQRVNLEEIKSKRLRGYGEVPDELREFLDTQVDRIMNLIDEICEIASSKHKDTGT